MGKLLYNTTRSMTYKKSYFLKPKEPIERLLNRRERRRRKRREMKKARTTL